MTDPTTLPYRPGVGMMLLDAQKHVFVAKRIDTTSEAWQMPQGGIDEGESPRIAAMRELREETGVTKAEIITESADWLTYDLPANLIPKIWKGRFRGQKQKWYVMQLIGDDEQINIQTEHPEFSEWKWVKAHELPGLIVPFKRELYSRLIEEFAEYL
jgi:putative (di)nucleoside polyphosphate hydrolase